MHIINLTEYQSQLISGQDLPTEIIDAIETKYYKQIKLNYKRNSHIELMAQGWVGFIPLSADFAINIKPKVPLQNLLGMLNYTLNLKSFYFLEGVAHCESLIDVCERLAWYLIENIINRKKKGLYASYINLENELSVIKGKINLKKNIPKFYNLKLNCHYQNQTNDMEDNQILLWTLYCLSRSKIFNQKFNNQLRKCYHALQNVLTLKQFEPQDCLNRTYNRLNQDYEIIHRICYFFLAYLMPTHTQGATTTLPFLVNMAQLYEEFVAQWLKTNLPSHLRLKIHEGIKINEDLKFNLDLVIYDRKTQKVCYVLDTKYKTKFYHTDYHQIVSYANQKHCENAVLIYPQNLEKTLNESSGKIKVRSLKFALDQDLEIAGKNFLEDLLNIN